MELIKSNVLKFTSLKPVPEKFTMTNRVSSRSTLKDKEQCQPGFTLFKQGTNVSPYWGSSRPIPEVCPMNFSPHIGTPSHSVWNNMTRRISVVEGNK